MVRSQLGSNRVPVDIRLPSSLKQLSGKSD